MIPSAKDEKQLTADLVERHLFDHYKQLWHENAFIGRFHFSLERDAASVRLKGHNCTAGASAMPTTTGTGSVGHAGTAIDGELREAVFDHRAAVVAAEAQIRYLQDYTRICQQTPEAAQ